jgi:hypothetical protein
MTSRIKIISMIDAGSGPLLSSLPWDKPLEAWRSRDARFLRIKCGTSRHVVRFIRRRKRQFAIKETSVGAAHHEFRAYKRLRDLAIPTLTPVGIVVREEGIRFISTPAGPQPEVQANAFLITELLDYALPNSYLFRRGFTVANRRHIWDAIIRLFVMLHCGGVYWGDASLANMMIVFAREKFPEIGVRTVLRAVLADAETVEFHPAISDAMRRADVEFFLESMEWTDADMRASGIIRDPLMTKDDQEYILQRYHDLYEIEREEQSFEILTNMDVEALLGPFQTKGQSKALLKHIYEHRWYLSELAGREVSLEEASRDWYQDVFKPVLMLMGEFGIVEEMPDKTAASLYLDIMLHKFLLSERVGRDVGLLAAFRDFSKHVGPNRRLQEKLTRFSDSLQERFGRAAARFSAPR